MAATINLLGGNNALVINKASNSVSLPTVRATASGAGSTAPHVYFVRVYATDGSRNVIISDSRPYPSLSSRSLSVPNKTLPVGSWKIMYEFRIDAPLEEGGGGSSTITVTIDKPGVSGNANPDPGTLTYFAPLNRTDITGTGFQTKWVLPNGSSQGFKATGAGAKVIRDGEEMEALGGSALNNLSALKNIVLCTSYPENPHTHPGKYLFQKLRIVMSSVL